MGVILAYQQTMRWLYATELASDCFSDSDDEANVSLSAEANKLIIEEQYFTDVEKINFYKKKLELEPEFIGLKNVSAAVLYDIINSVDENVYMNVRKVILRESVKRILDDLFSELNGEYVSEYFHKILITKIYNKCYC